MTTIAWIVTGTGAVAAVYLSAMRWLRVAQREHYLAPSTTVFARRWWTSSPLNSAIATAGLLSVPAAGLIDEWFWSGAILVVSVGPIGLSVKGRTSPLAWTRRLRTTAMVATAIDGSLVVVASLVGSPWRGATLAVTLMVQPMVIDAALVVLSPIERRGMQRFVDQATARLRAVSPTTVAITGSYGKTTTKIYLRHLVSGTRSVLASPASFNNTGGLARTMNEHLTPGTDVLIAEMGTYGAGEIRSLCAWVKPDIAAIVNIGPVHLERMKTLDDIVAAKAEIFDNASICVVNTDAVGLEDVAARLRVEGRRVITTSATNPSADVLVATNEDGFTVHVAGKPIVTVERSDASASNVAGAVAMAMALSIPLDAIAKRLTDLPGSDHRRSVTMGASGATVIDNTFSSNPASALASLHLLAKLHAADPEANTHGRRFIVSPGMVELGRVQVEENERFGRLAGTQADEVVVVGRTNRAALVRGAAGGTANVHLMADRVQAVRWVRANAGPHDVVLYEGDLPDHYP